MRFLRANRAITRLAAASAVLVALCALPPAEAAAANGVRAAAAQSKSEVRGLQRALGISADGVFGPHTERAVKRFQRRHGLVADGVVGPVTRQALGLGSGPVLKRKGRPPGGVRPGGTPRGVPRAAACALSSGRSVSPPTASSVREPSRR